MAAGGACDALSAFRGRLVWPCDLPAGPGPEADEEKEEDDEEL